MSYNLVDPVTGDLTRVAGSGGPVSFPVGTILAYASDSIPLGWLLCDGSSFDADAYSALAQVLGSNVLPDLRGRFLEGANGNLGNTIDAGLPNITGEFGAQGSVAVPNVGTGAFRVVQSGKIDGGDSANTNYSLKQSFDASRSSAIYGKSNTVQPNSFTVNYIIKY